MMNAENKNENINDMYLVLSVADLRGLLKHATAKAKASAAASAVPVTDYNKRIARHCVVIEGISAEHRASGWQISSPSVVQTLNMKG